MLMIRRFSPKSYIHQKNYNRQKRITDKKIITDIMKIYHSLESFRNFLASTKKRIPRAILFVNNNISSTVIFFENRYGSATIMIKNAAAKSTISYDSISNQTLEGRFNKLMYL
jgi:hypothetical protein